MFRKPREPLDATVETQVYPSIGRPPTPPNSTRTVPSTMLSKPATHPLTPRANSKTNAPIPKSSLKKISLSKSGSKPNTSILSFFKKVDSPLKDDSIFVSSGRQAILLPNASAVDEDLEDLNTDENQRYNEFNGSLKRRKTSNEPPYDSGPTIVNPPTISDPRTNSEKETRATRKPIRSGFLPDSDSEAEGEESVTSLKTQPIEKLDSSTGSSRKSSDHISSGLSKPVDVATRKRVPIAEAQEKWEAMQPNEPEPRKLTVDDDASESEYEDSQPAQDSTRGDLYRSNARSRNAYSTEKSPLESHTASLNNVHIEDFLPQIPTLKQEATSIDEWAGLDDVEEYADDEYGEGEEYTERKWMEEQARLEAAEQALFNETFEEFDDGPTASSIGEATLPTCPICEASLAGINDTLASRHVNGCLDGNPVPLPAPPKVKEEEGEREVKFIPPGGSNRFIRKAAIARPGQANPIQIGSDGTTSKLTAFSEIMSGKAEDAAWANAAAAENASRGKPAYQRTCPFYKIMPGFFICVDAFRYGAVEGCNGYFLSHFHSDHYVGLTSSWCHGPIYCSKVTANLVKQQLRVDPKWVVALEFEVKVEVPNTRGVYVTMIPANHCPGSSLFLFEKVVGKGPSPKVQRILHCGDFRACPAHIAHPQLMPDIVDSLTGKTKQQKIDVCYLDTTYLNPRYAFPSQEEVIKSCADMCVSLSKDRADETDAWEVVKKQRAGAGMNNFVQTSIKAEDDSIAMEIGSTRTRGRLLVVCGTYSIGKERICMGIARALDCKIWAPPGKMRICAALEDPELMSRMTDDPKEAQIHMQMLMEIRAETLQEYLNSYKPHFSRIVGFRPSGWNYRPPNSRFTDSPSISTILNSSNWKSTYSMAELVPQRGSTREASCFGVPYSEHSSFRELTMFVCALRIEKVVPTVNVGSAASRAKMKSWIDKWLAERRKQGVIKIGDGEGEVRW